MTCVVGIATKGKVYIAGDSCGIAGLEIITRKDTKVFTNGEFIFGFTTSFRMGQILHYDFEPPEVKHDDLMFYMVKTFIPAVRAKFKECGYSSVTNNTESGGDFLIGGRGRLFSIQSDFQVGENLNGYAAMGCGDSYAYGSLHTTEADKTLKPEWRLEQALKAAEAFSAGVSAPFNYVTT